MHNIIGLNVNHADSAACIIKNNSLEFAIEEERINRQKHWDLKRIIRYLPKDYQLLYTARQILISRGYGVDEAIKKVPQKLKVKMLNG